MFVDTQEQISQDWQSLARYLESQGHRFDIEKGIRQFAAGAANMNYLIFLDGEKVVLRCPPKGAAPGANDVAREYKVLSGLGAGYPYAPRALHLCEDSTIIGVPFCISEFREGTAIGLELPPEIADKPGIGKRLSELTIGALAALHRVDPESAGLADLGRAEGFLERQVEGWFKRGQRVLVDEDLATAGLIVAWLRANLPDYRPSSIVHNDFKLDNMLIDLETLELKAVLDWDMCTIGDPLYDLMLVLVYWGQPGDGAVCRRIARMPFDADGWLSRRQALEYYLSINPLPMTESAMHCYWVLGLYRLAVVYAQLVALFRSGAMSSVHVNADNVDEVMQTAGNILREARSQMDGLSAFA